MATTLDNKCCANDKTSKWITSEKSRLDSHLLRSKVQCIITTANTVLADYPRLNVRIGEKQEDKFVVVLDRNNKLSEDDIKKCGWNKYIVWKSNIEELIPFLYVEYNIISVLIECGSNMYNEVIRLGIWNRLYLYMSMSTLGTNAYNTNNDITRGNNIGDRKNIGKLIECKQIENDIKIIIEKE
jgi:diaminohydroxyphosphoribosylaminopyrimidine deaminase/5-amino-6-(5-phosphoribosylamino)uracil reductase